MVFGLDIMTQMRGEHMKKIVFALITMVSAVTLTSCEFNWFGSQYDVAWWVIAAPTILFSAIIFFAAGKYIASQKYVCPKCNKTFYPKWWKAAVSIHINDDRVFKCPHCQRRGFCSPSKESED